jgi:PAS domain S-box-containing protein
MVRGGFVNNLRLPLGLYNLEGLCTSEGLLNDLFERSPFGIFISTPDGELVAVNDVYVRQFGYASREECIRTVNGEGGTETFYARPRQRQSLIEALSRSSDWIHIETRFRAKDKSAVDVNLYLNSLIIPGESNTLLLKGFVEDITERKAIARGMLEEKELLLRELSHRVKNNLQLVVSIMKLQLELRDGAFDVSSFIRETMNRIMSMAAVYEFSTDSVAVSRIPIRQYFDLVFQSISLDSGADDTETVQVACPDDCTFPADITMPLGLAVIELVSPLFGPENKDSAAKSMVSLQIERAGPDYVAIIKAPMGTWASIGKLGSTDLRSEIVRSLIAQFHGLVEVDAGDSGQLRILIPSALN